MMKKLLVFLSYLSLCIGPVMAQENPFRSLRDGAPERLPKKQLIQAKERFSEAEIATVKTDLDNYYLSPQTTKQFLETQFNKDFVKREIKHCQKTLKNVVVNCQKYIQKLFLIRLRADSIIDDVTFLALLKPEQTALDLKTIEQKFFFINLEREKNNPDKAYQTFDFNPMSGKDFRVKVNKKLKNLTPRQRLYLLYSHEQIIKMGEIIKKATVIMNSKSVTIVVDFDGDGKPDMDYIELSFSGKYNLAIKYIKHLIKQEIATGVLAGQNPNFTDLLCAAMEVGYFDAKELQAMLELPELRDPKVDGWKKAGKIIWTITKAGIMAIPGYGPLISIPIVLIEAIIEGKKQNATHADHSDDIF